MHACIRGILAGLVATAVLAALLWLNTAAGLVPGLDLVTLIARVLGESREAGWWLLAGIGIGGIGMALAALVDPADAEVPWRPAAILCGAGWLAVMMGLLPMAGHAPFGLGLGWLAPLLAAAWAAAYGAVLALSWTWLPRLPDWLAQHLRDGTAPTASLRS